MISAAEARNVSVANSAYMGQIDKLIRSRASRGTYHAVIDVASEFYVDGVCKALEEAGYKTRVIPNPVDSCDRIVICWHPNCDWE